MLFIEPPEYLKASDFYNTSMELIKNASENEDFISSILNFNVDQERDFYRLEVDDFDLLVGFN